MGEEVHSIKLAQVPPFRLGAVLVDPPRRRVARGAQVILLEPRVMQVLVVLAEARGAVISRDELIERCWGGRIVGENAINRVISRLRQLAGEIGLDAFQLETITKVGYRMVAAMDEVPVADLPIPWPEEDRAPSRAPLEHVEEAAQRARLSRRALLAGGLLAAGLGAGGYWLWGRGGHQPPAEAAELHRRAQFAQRQGQPEQVRQAVAFFQRATELDPLYAEAWGGLALCYRHLLEGYGQAEAHSLPGLIESAARRALDLDPDNADAQVALALVKPFYGNWGAIERELMRLAERHADHWFVQAQLGIGRYETGRWRDGLPHTERQIEIEPHIPIPRVMRTRALWSLGRLQEAEAESEAAVRRWPANSMLWVTRFHLLLFGNRPGAAAAFAMDPDTRLEGVPAEAVEANVRLARAAERRVPAEMAAVVERAKGLTDVQEAPYVAPVFALFGRNDLALDAAERYFLGAPAGPLGPAAAAPGPYDRRYTSMLFLPSMAPVRGEPRFAALLERTGLERYWRESDTQPDFRRT